MFSDAKNQQAGRKASPTSVGQNYRKLWLITGPNRMSDPFHSIQLFYFILSQLRKIFKFKLSNTALNHHSL
jgi:curved DNA-binding protein CbpA